MLRLVDLLPSAYLVGLLCIMLTSRNQRLGDLAAGTLVIRDAPARGSHEPAPVAARRADVAGWDVSAVSAEETAAVRRFLERRGGLDHGARAALAARLAQGLRAKVAGAPRELDPEGFLEALAEAKSQR